ncbi:DoxX family protein [Candidatus Woesearchaeota archaeon]|nr:DoxX family protein [Candidatus Woesearchaeota archaeon]
MNNAILVLRTYFGIAFLVAGLDKLFHLDMAGKMFEMWFPGFGAAMLWLAIAIEVIGGVTLLSGYYTQYAAGLFIPFMLVATAVTWKIGGMDVISMVREMLVMNTAGGNTPVNLAYIAGLTALVLLNQRT